MNKNFWYFCATGIAGAYTADSIAEYGVSGGLLETAVVLALVGVVSYVGSRLFTAN